MEDSVARERLESAIVDGEPNRRLVRRGPLDAVPPVGRNRNEVAGLHGDSTVVVLKPQPGFTAQHDDPLVLILVVVRIERRSRDRDAEVRAVAGALE